MDKLKSFVQTSLLGGIIVILPVALLIVIFGWIFRFVTNFIQPLTDILVAKSDFRETIAAFLVLVIIVAACFLVIINNFLISLSIDAVSPIKPNRLGFVIPDR